jgi:acyl-CoA thioesterase I
MIRPRRPAALLAAVVGVGVLLGGCSSASDQPAGDRSSASRRTADGATGSSTSAPTPTRVRTYVAVGASETVGVGADDPATQAWPVVLHDRALPESRLVNVGVSGATLEGALATQLPPALAADPDVVTVWLAVNDVIAGVPVRTYQRRLGRLVHALRRDGRTEVLVGNVPELWRLPAYRACLPGERSKVACLLPFVPAEREVRALVAAVNRAVQRVVRREGARLVDLSGVPFGARLTSSDGFHPSTAGHRRLAAAFARVL